MSKLDFTQKYKTSDANDEIDMLGENINLLSDRLENTINQLRNTNIELEKDIEEKSKIDEMRNEIKLFFKGCSPESEESFKNFIESICVYLSLIAQKPLHPIGMDFRNNNTVFSEETDGKTVYYCDIKQKQAEIAKDYYTCKYCVCIPSELK